MPLREELPNNEFFGEEVSDKLLYYPTVTREPYRNRGRITDLISSGQLFADLGLPPLDQEHDRAMICGSSCADAMSCSADRELQ